VIGGQPGKAGVLVSAQADVPVPEVEARADGSWRVTATVPAGARTGRHQVLARCVEAGGAHAFTYGEAVFFVTAPGETPEVHVSASTVVRGSRITATGTGCLVYGRPGQIVALTLFRGAAHLDEISGEVAANGDWSAEIAVPTNAQLGTAPLGAHCRGVDGSVEVFYVPAILTVIDSPTPAPGPTPPVHHGPAAVKVTPRFTG
jgi:hypothetical protein